MTFSWPEMIEHVDLPGDSMHVWAVPLEIDGSRLRMLEQRLSSDERQRASRFVRDEPRRNFIGSRAALRSLLGQYLDMPADEVPIIYDPNGKPRLAGVAADTGLQFNLAHSDQLALVAVTYGCDVGVDIEELRPIEHWREIAARYFHPAETDAIAAADPSEQNAAFLRCWTRKEAILKALGLGLGQSLKSFAVPVAARIDSWVELFASPHPPSTHSRFWLQSLAPCFGYVAAVATGIEKRKVTGFIYRR